MENENIYIGIDLGGTSIKMGVVNQDGELLHSFEQPTPNGPYQEVIDTFDEMVQLLFTKHGFDREKLLGVGIGVPGFVDTKTSEIIELPNLQWKNVTIKKELEQKWHVPVELENDANAAALGEMWVGAGRGAKHMLCLTVGTGIGGGIIIDGDIYHGATGMAGEVGHFKVKDEDGKPCNCGQNGCLETEVSATAIEARAMEAMQKETSTGLTEAYERTGHISTRDVVELAKQKDPVCEQIMIDAGVFLGKTLAKVCVLLNPERIIIGGGVSNADELLLTPLIQTFKKHSLARIAQHTSIEKAKLGNKAGMIGAAWLLHRNDL